MTNEHNDDRDRDADYWRWNDRRRNTYDLEEQHMEKFADRIAEKVAPKAAAIAKQLVLDEIAMTVGRGIISRVSWAVGLAFIAVALWLAGTGHIKP